MKIAVIGTGKLGQRHLDSWSKMNDIEIVGVIARNKVTLKEVAEKYGTKTFRSIQELLISEEVDVIDICTPTDTHAEMIKEAALAKTHVICEKPLALTAEEAAEAIAVCEQNEVQLLVGHTLRFFPEYVNAREQVKSGAIGKSGVIRMKRGVPFPDEKSWYGDELQSGGLFLDSLGIHDFDWLLWTFGDVERVLAKRVKHTSINNRLEYGFVTLKMLDGTIAYVELSWAETQFTASFELAGDKGMIAYNHNESNPLSIQIRSKVETNKKGVEIPQSVLEKDPYFRQLEHFIHCLTGKAKPIISTFEAMKAVRIARAAIQSAEEGQPITIKGGAMK